MIGENKLNRVLFLIVLIVASFPIVLFLVRLISHPNVDIHLPLVPIVIFLIGLLACFFGFKKPDTKIKFIILFCSLQLLYLAIEFYAFAVGEGLVDRAQFHLKVVSLYYQQAQFFRMSIILLKYFISPLILIYLLFLNLKPR
jgi:hypothetical protein